MSVSQSVYLFVCLTVTIVSPAKTAQPIKMMFGVWTWVGPRRHVLDGVHLANAVEPSMCSGDAACFKLL